MKLSGLVLLLVCFCLPAFAGFDATAYEKAEPPLASMPIDFFYPPYFKQNDSLTLRNIRQEIVFRIEFIAGIRPEPRYMNCFKMQKRIENALNKYREADEKLVLRRLDDELVFNESSPLEKYLRPMPIPATNNCSYRSAADLSSEGMLYCVYHGPLQDSEVYQKYEHLFTAEKPFITAFDFVELLIFSPVLLIMPVTWLIMRKLLEKNH
ncbi:MAG: hypothetical protein CVV41_17390 [Candidatus Riflebacteria bacterium HGW-Riflebacteria-1]|jgi:hypothetical protein|nr:MAG: hypothetical protein CVV41_17390 [Candidatus Riflebacteria bacterium HGW-Riflebacteria-1]